MVDATFYDENYVRWALDAYESRGSSHRKLRAIERALHLQHTDVLVDIGCGPGVLLKCYSPHVSKAIGVDYSAACVSAAKNLNHSADIYQVDLEHETLPFHDAVADKIIFIDVIEHLEDPNHILSEMHRILKPGGIGVITTLPNKASFFYVFFEFLKRLHLKSRNLMDEEDHPVLYSMSSLKNILRAHGFTIKQTQTYRVLAPLQEILKMKDNDYLDYRIFTHTFLGEYLASGLFVVVKKEI